MPDTKGWTWVLGRPCPECGFDASTGTAMAVPRLIRDNFGAWKQPFADGGIRPGRPDADPLFSNWDQDAPEPAG